MRWIDDIKDLDCTRPTDDDRWKNAEEEEEELLASTLQVKIK